MVNSAGSVKVGSPVWGGLWGNARGS
jgi:hypothetical protein